MWSVSASRRIGRSPVSSPTRLTMSMTRPGPGARTRLSSSVSSATSTPVSSDSRWVDDTARSTLLAAEWSFASADRRRSPAAASIRSRSARWVSASICAWRTRRRLRSIDWAGTSRGSRPESRFSSAWAVSRESSAALRRASWAIRSTSSAPAASTPSVASAWRAQAAARFAAARSRASSRCFRVSSSWRSRALWPERMARSAPAATTEPTATGNCSIRSPGGAAMAITPPRGSNRPSAATFFGGTAVAIGLTNNRPHRSRTIGTGDTIRMPGSPSRGQGTGHRHAALGSGTGRPTPRQDPPQAGDQWARAMLLAMRGPPSAQGRQRGDSAPPASLARAIAWALAKASSPFRLTGRCIARATIRQRTGWRDDSQAHSIARR